MAKSTGKGSPKNPAEQPFRENAAPVGDEFPEDAESAGTALETPSFIVGIGASAGGLEALERFLKAMPNDSGMAFVIIQHLSPDFKSLMH